MNAAKKATDRAALLLARPGAWLEASGGGYLVRSGPDRRRRPLLKLDATAFTELALRPRPEGGWVSLPPPGRPGVVEGERLVAEPDGRLVARRVNLGESPIAWLARRGWLTPTEAAAGERLRDDFHTAGALGRLTMNWDAGPKSSYRGLDPAERATAAKVRIAKALAAVGPGLREMLEHVCLAGSALEAAERTLGLPRRSGKAVLKLGLQRLAAHYGL